MKRLLWFGAAVIAFALGTWMVAWWTVPAVGAALGLARRVDQATPLLGGLAAMVAWGVLLALSASGAPEGSVSVLVGQALGVGPGALIAMTILYPGLLAASAAACMAWGAERYSKSR